MSFGVNVVILLGARASGLFGEKPAAFLLDAWRHDFSQVARHAFRTHSPDHLHECLNRREEADPSALHHPNKPKTGSLGTRSLGMTHGG